MDILRDELCKKLYALGSASGKKINWNIELENPWLLYFKLFEILIKAEHALNQHIFNLKTGYHIGFRFLTGQVDKRTLEKYEREAKEKNRETW